MDAEILQDVLGVGQNVHQVRNRRALIAPDIGDAGLQQRLGDRENPLAAKNLAVAEFQILDLACKRAFGHVRLSFRAAEAALAFISFATAYFYARDIAMPNSDWLGSGQMPLKTRLFQQSART